MSDNAAINAKIAELEAEMARTQKNKATNYHLGTLKAKIAKLKSELINGPGGKSAGTKNAERGFDVTKSGDTLESIHVSNVLSSPVNSLLPHLTHLSIGHFSFQG